MRLCLAGLFLIPFFCSAQYFTRVSNNFALMANGNVEWVDLDNDNDTDLIYAGLVNNVPTTVIYENVLNVLTLKTNTPTLTGFATADYDKDGDTDLLGYTGSTVMIYINNGAFNFSAGPVIGSYTPLGVRWFDLDNDEDLDILIAGGAGQTVIENTGSGFTETNIAFYSCYCAVDVADVNGDGRTDVALSGEKTAVFLNAGNKTFTLYQDTQLQDRYSAGVAWGDFDNDGDLDLVSAGSFAAQPKYLSSTTIYENQGNKFIARSNMGLTDMTSSINGIRWFNFDNDGLLDILITGFTDPTNVFSSTTRIMKNNGNGTFTPISDAYLVTTGANGAVDVGDFLNDGDTDIAFEGVYYALEGLPNPTAKAKPISGYYRNDTKAASLTNTPPLPPDINTFKEKFRAKTITLKWGNGSDTQTATGGLFYNFYLRSDAKKIIIPNSNLSTGKLLTNNIPNATGRAGYAYDVPEGNLYYGVQAIDGAKVGSSFSAEKTFFHINGPEAVNAQIVDATHAKLTWLDHSAIETNFDVRRSLAPATGFSNVTTLSANATTYTDNFSFGTETPYYYQIKGYSAQGSAYDSMMFVIPAQATDLVGQTMGAASIKLSWKDNSQYETNYIVERRQGAAAFAAVATLAPNTQEYSDTSLDGGTSYDYRVRVINSNGSIDPVLIVSAMTNARPVCTPFSFVGDEDNTLEFTSAPLNSNFTDANSSDKLQKIKIKKLPANGTLYVYTSKAVVGQEVTPDLFDFIEFKPDKDFAGDVSLTVIASDGMDYSDNDWVITLTLNQVNDAPDFYPIDSKTLTEDFVGDVSFQPYQNYYTGEGTQVVTYTLSPATSDIVDIIFNKSTGLISFAALKNKFGVIEFTLTADDGQVTNHSYSQKFKLTILAANDPPTLAPIANVEVATLDPIEIALDIQDPDNDIVTSMLYANSSNLNVVKPSGVTFTRNGDGTFKMTITMVPTTKGGKTTIVVYINNGGFYVQQQFTLTVAEIVTGLLEADNDIDIYPNPFSEIINIQSTDGHRLTVTLKDMLGHLIRTQDISQSTSVDVSDLAAGVYMIEIMKDNQYLSRKTIVKSK